MEMDVKVVSAPACQDSSLGSIPKVPIVIKISKNKKAPELAGSLSSCSTEKKYCVHKREE
jgi:hypothetical protein